MTAMDPREVARIYDGWAAADAPPLRRAQAAAERLGVTVRDVWLARSAYGEAAEIEVSSAGALHALAAELGRAGPLLWRAERRAAAIEVVGTVEAISPLHEHPWAAIALSRPEGGAEAIWSTERIGTAFVGSAAAGADPEIALLGDDGATLMSVRATPGSARSYIARLADLLSAGAASGRARAPIRRADPLDADVFDARWAPSAHRQAIETGLAAPSDGRAAAYRAMAPGLATQVSPGAARAALIGAAMTKTEIALRAGAPGASLTAFGPLSADGSKPDIAAQGRGMTMAVALDAVADAWIVRSPMQDGVVTLLDSLDARGASLCQLYGRRPNGESLCRQGPGCWRAILSDFVLT